MDERGMKMRKVELIYRIAILLFVCGVVFVGGGCSDTSAERHGETANTASESAPYVVTETPEPVAETPEQAAARVKAEDEARTAAEKNRRELEKARKIAEEKAKKKEAVAEKKRLANIKNFPIKLKKVKITRGKGNSNATYVSISVKNTGKYTIKSFEFTYIGYDEYGESRSDADEDTFVYKGKIKPGKTNNLISKGHKWLLTDHTSESWYDDWGGDYDDYYGGDGYYRDDARNPYQVRTIEGVQVSIYRAVTTKNKEYSLDAYDRTWSKTVYLK